MKKPANTLTDARLWALELLAHETMSDIAERYGERLDDVRARYHALGLNVGGERRERTLRAVHWAAVNACSIGRTIKPHESFAEWEDRVKLALRSAVRRRRLSSEYLEDLYARPDLDEALRVLVDQLMVNLLPARKFREGRSKPAKAVSKVSSQRRRTKTQNARLKGRTARQIELVTGW